MTKIQAIQAELISAYEAISLPNSLGTPTGYKHEPTGRFTSDELPAVVVTRGVLLNTTPLSSDRSREVREYITDLFCYVMNDADPNNATSRNNTSDCISVISSAFKLYELDTVGVIEHQITADTSDTEIFDRDDTTNYVGVRFRHQVTYIQEK